MDTTQEIHVKPTDEEVQNIIDQAPEWVTAVQVYELWNEYKGNVVEILSKLWNVPPPSKKEPTKWETMREICDAHDQLMEEMLEKLRNESPKLT